MQVAATYQAVAIIFLRNRCDLLAGKFQVMVSSPEDELEPNAQPTSSLDSMQAAILPPKLAVFDEELSLRQQVANRYNKLLESCRAKFIRADTPPVIANKPLAASEAWREARQSLPQIVLPHIEPHNTSAWAQYTVRVQDREDIQAKLRAGGIPTAIHYPIPLNKQPAVADASVQLLRGDEAAQQVISSPPHSYLSSAAQQNTMAAILQAGA
jgi:UDP-2-acetamido-2-deoxy-ribo-hexuluronate aminotransferase